MEEMEWSGESAGVKHRKRTWAHKMEMEGVDNFHFWNSAIARKRPMLVINTTIF